MESSKTEQFSADKYCYDLTGLVCDRTLLPYCLITTTSGCPEHFDTVIPFQISFINASPDAASDYCISPGWKLLRSFCEEGFVSTSELFCQ
jgi:hypothetical protein